MDSTGQTANSTDWNCYYRDDPFLSRFTRPFIWGMVLRALQRYSVPHPVIVELGGAGGRFFDLATSALQPTAYHIVDTNEYGLKLIQERADPGSVFLHLRDVRNPAIDVQADMVFSMGLIEHFRPEDTRRVILSHLDLLKPGGFAVITFPTPTLLYRVSRRISELAGWWIFHDERPMRVLEVRQAIEGAGALLYEHLIWQTPFTQTIIVIQKRELAPDLSIGFLLQENRR